MSLCLSKASVYLCSPSFAFLSLLELRVMDYSFIHFTLFSHLFFFLPLHNPCCLLGLRALPNPGKHSVSLVSLFSSTVSKWRSSISHKGGKGMGLCSSKTARGLGLPTSLSPGKQEVWGSWFKSPGVYSWREGWHAHLTGQCKELALLHPAPRQWLPGTGCPLPLL